MEPAQVPLRYKIPTTVQTIEERFKKHRIEGRGDSTIFQDESLGWYVQFTGSYEALYLGMDKPQFVVGDHVNITIEKAQDAILSQPPI